MLTKAHDDLCDVAQPLISVVTPSLNHGRFLRQTIESVAAQSFRSFEHIVVDGGSTDGALEWLMQQKDIITIVQHNRSRFILQKDFMA